MLVDLIFEKDETIRSHRYTIINKEQATIFAWIKITRADGTPGVLWMKATALYDAKGAFIAALSMVRDITDELGEELLRQADDPSAPKSIRARSPWLLTPQAESSRRQERALSAPRDP